jgi:hypothetical protein
LLPRNELRCVFGGILPDILTQFISIALAEADAILRNHQQGMLMTEQRIGRNDSCPCGSGTKFKRCHGAPEGAARVPEVRHYIDTGESPVRWVISNDSGTAFFADKQGRVMVFADKRIALEIAQLDMFSSQEPNEINVAGVGPTKWQHLQESLPFLEVSSAEMAIALIQERISAKTAGEEVAESVPEINQELAPE